MKLDGRRWLGLVFLCFILTSCHNEPDEYIGTSNTKPVKEKTAWEQELQNAKVAAFSGDDALAESKFAAIIKLLKNNPDKVLVVAEVKARMAKIYLKQGHIKTAVPLVEQALETVKEVKIDSAENSELLVLMDDLAELIGERVEESDKDYPDLLILITKLQKASHSGIHNRSVLLHVKLSNYYIARDDMDKAKPFIDETIRIINEEKLARPYGTIPTVLSIYYLLMEKGYKSEADRVYKAVYNKLESLSGKTASARINQMLGQLYFSSHNLDKAVKFYNKSLEEQKKFHDPGMESNTVEHLATVEEAKGNIKEADKLMTKALELQRESPGKLSQDLVKRLERYRDFAIKYGDKKKAILLDKEAKSYRAKFIQF